MDQPTSVFVFIVPHYSNSIEPLLFYKHDTSEN